MLTLKNYIGESFPQDFPRSDKKYSTEEKIAKIISLSQGLTQKEKEELDKVEAEIEQRRFKNI